MSIGNASLPILVTGMQNSGTTWVGKMLSLPKEVVYIHEPFNLNREFGICHVLFDSWYTYITDDNHERYYEGISKTIGFQYDLINSLKDVRGPVGLLRRLRENSYFKEARENNYRPLLKDPIALFSAPWISKNFNTAVLITIRHPAAVVNSNVKRGWHSPLKDLFSQELLMRDYLAPYEQEIIVALENTADRIYHFSLLWKIMYSMVAEYMRLYPSWIFVKHEDLVIDPIKKYEELYASLRIPFDSNLLRKKIKPKSRTGLDMANEWKEKLSIEQVRRIQDIVGDTANLYYSEDSWV